VNVSEIVDVPDAFYLCRHNNVHVILTSSFPGAFTQMINVLFEYRIYCTYFRMGFP
jgi:hypothetical protein